MSRARQKGTAWETRLVRYLKDAGFAYVERRALSGRADKGDISGIPGLVIEAKNSRRVELAQWVDEMVAEKKNAGAQIGAVVFPRRSHATGRAYVVLELADFVELVR